MMSSEIDDRLLALVDKLLYIVNYHKLENALDLRKFIYTKNFNEEEYKKMKKLFDMYGEQNIFNCIFFYKENAIKNKSALIKKIKGE